MSYSYYSGTDITSALEMDSVSLRAVVETMSEWRAVQESGLRARAEERLQEDGECVWSSDGGQQNWT